MQAVHSLHSDKFVRIKCQTVQLLPKINVKGGQGRRGQQFLCMDGQLQAKGNV